MSEQRSPCIHCEHLSEDKLQCAAACEKLEAFQEDLPHFSLWGGEDASYGFPGLERKPIYKFHE
ncbi:MAG TPA: hypothetical protein VMV04_18080 [Thermodesulfobacteriota bacterium]|jgi:hypothetical protein|nr:hypothetical protein [Thermodesulfobacteriota bacterium]